MTPNPMGRMLVTVQAPHYCATLIIGRRTFPGGVVVLEAAPIVRWALGKSWLTVKHYFDRKGFRIGMQPDPASLPWEERRKLLVPDPAVEP